ncbi:MAG: DNA-processing protein DprA [Clostridia bacterium]|nr:DNA-processing protein DprA [Clostridia bacterium]
MVHDTKYAGTKKELINTEIINNEVNYIDAADERFPDSLRMIEDPPRGLYYVGNIQLLKTPSASVVGSRKATEYGKWVSKSIGTRLGTEGVTVISGLAVGIDSYAHMGALKAEGKTIAVLGGGINVACPAPNRNLMREIIYADGLVISEYEPGVTPSRFTFPRRNRIISGLSSATVVVEAGFGSGSLITAEYAAKQGKNVYAVPGNITSQASLGCNKLIYDGAIPLIVIEDILNEFNIEIKKSQGFSKKLGHDELTVCEYVANSGETDIDHICVGTGMSPGKASGIVTVLEMKGVICTGMGKIFIAK